MRDSATNSVFAETGSDVPAMAPALMSAMLFMGALPFAIMKLEAYRGRRSAGWWAVAGHAT